MKGTNMSNDEIHKWEYHNVGKAPFKVIGIWDMPSKSLLEHNPEAWNNAMRGAPLPAVGCCYVCGTGIVIHYIIQDANGTKFAVGSECVKKSGDRGMTTKAKLLKNERDREIRQRKAEAQRTAQLQAEREKNGGLTDHEVQLKKWQEEEEAKLQALAPVIELLAPLADRLEDGRDGFCDSIAETLRNGELPSGRGRSITLDILAKQAGRRNSKAYDAEYDEVSSIFEQVEEMN